MHLRYLLTTVAALLLTGSVQADFAYVFVNTADSTNTPTNTFNVGQGSTVTIAVYLEQTNGPTTNSTNLSANGLVAGGVALQYSSTAPFSTTAGAITPNSAFLGPNNSGVSTSGNTTSAVLQVNSSSPVYGATVLGGSSSSNAAVLLGTFTFTGNTVGSAVTVSALPNASSANNVDGAMNNLDSLIQNSSATITVVAVPEPASILLTSLAVAGFGAGVVRRRFFRKPERIAAGG
jgi:hypothetical protein